MASTGEVWKLGHRPALDGVRGIAVLLVVAYHAMPEWVGSGGAVGVTMFFTLSGFLITALLDQEYDDRGRISLRGFFARRARRLLPALGVLLVAVLALRELVHPQFAENRWLVGAVFYFNNWNAIAVGDHVSLGLQHTWSLAIEEQFYLLFPLLAAGLLRRRVWLIWTVGVGAVLSFGLRIGMWATAGDSARWYYGTDTTVGTILLGALAALLLKRRPVTGSPRVAAAIVGGLAAAALLPDSSLMRASGMVVVSAATALTLVMLSGRPAPQLLVSPTLRYVGRRSYGLYLWHLPVMWMLLPLHSQPVLLLTALLPSTFAIAEVSWWLVERPFQSLNLSRLRVAEAFVTAKSPTPRGAWDTSP